MDKTVLSESYSAYMAGGNTPSLDNAAQNCRMVELGFVPYQLSHLKVPITEEVKIYITS